MLITKKNAQKYANSGAGDTSDSITVTLTISVSKTGSYLSYAYSETTIEFYKTPNVIDTLTVNLVVDNPAYSSRYYISSYSASPIAPVSTVPAATQPGNVLPTGCASVALNFQFSDVKSDQTYLELIVKDTVTGELYTCDPQVGNDADIPPKKP